MLTHLISRYGKFTEEEIEANEAVLLTPFDISQSFESFIKRMQLCKSYADEAEEPITDGRLTRIAVGLINATHLFPTPLDKWNDKASADKTWDKFKKHFQKSQENLSTAGIANNAMIQAGVEATQTDGANLVAINHSTQDQITNLTPRISAMGLQLAAAQANTVAAPTKTKQQQLEEQAALNEKLQTRNKLNRNNNNNNNNSQNNNHEHRVRPANQEPPRAQRRFPGNRNYCWSCGFNIANKHTRTS
jgi:hypothetical protein